MNKKYFLMFIVLDCSTLYAQETTMQPQVDEHRQEIHQKIVELNRLEKQKQEEERQQALQRRQEMVNNIGNAQKNTPAIQTVPNPNPNPVIVTPTNTSKTGNSDWLTKLFFLLSIGGVGAIFYKLLKSNKKTSLSDNNRRNIPSNATNKKLSQYNKHQTIPSLPQNQSGSSQNVSPLTSTDLARKYLDDFFSLNPQNKMRYQNELKALDLDYSEASLHRIDDFLAKIKQRDKPNFTNFVEDYESQQFLIFLGIYLGTTIACLTHQYIKWFSYEEAKQQLQIRNYPETIGTLFTAILGYGFHYLPIETICDGLFTAIPENTCIERLNFYQSQAEPLILMPISYNKKVIARNSQELAWQNTLKDAGFLVAHSLYMIETGSDLIPTLSENYSDGQKLLNSLIDVPDEQVQMRLEHNPNNWTNASYVQDIFANFPKARIDSLHIDVVSYAPNAGRWTIIIPYQNANHPKGFAVFTPVLAQSNIKNRQFDDLIFGAFYQGMQSFNSPSKSWQSYFQDNINFI